MEINMASNPTISPQLVPFLFIFLFFSPFLVKSYRGPPNLSSWCNQTPYPTQCQFHLNNNPFSDPIKEKSHFLKLVIQNLISNVQKAHQIAHYQVSNSINGLEKASWKDCLSVYELSIQHLNQTISNPNCTQFDVQTWLSSALTLFQTCEYGFSDLGVTKNIMSTNTFSNNNISYLFSNALAINGPQLKDGGFYEPKDNKFPTWVQPSDRKLLEFSNSNQANFVVAQDASGNYKTIGEAISDVSQRIGDDRIVILIKKGIYNENVKIESNMKNIMLLGEGVKDTVITGSRSHDKGSTTYDSATLIAEGSGFIAKWITFKNTETVSQAVAFRCNSDLSVLHQCNFEGYQDTLYVHSNRQFYRECDIYGTVDFIFGNAAVVIQNCNIYPRRQLSVITAQGRTDPNQNTGIVIHNSRVELLKDSTTYLGRPWKPYSRTVFMKTYLSDCIDPKGWLQWNDDTSNLGTLYYGEYANTGPGAPTTNRVDWPGYHAIEQASEVTQFSVENFIDGNSWLPCTDVPFDSGI